MRNGFHCFANKVEAKSLRRKTLPEKPGNRQAADAGNGSPDTSVIAVGPGTSCRFIPSRADGLACTTYLDSDRTRPDQGLASTQ